MSAAASFLSSVDRYQAIASQLHNVSETPERLPARSQSEMEIQAAFFGGHHGEEFHTLCGHTIQLLDPGEWNRESGPDFFNATVLVDGSERIRGDIEIDLCSSGWEEHAHATNPEFENVILHLFCSSGKKHTFARTRSHRAVFQVLLPHPNASGPTTAGTGARSALPPEPLGNLDDALALLRTAAAARFRRKSAQFATLARLHGVKNALFQSIAASLGFKHNSIPMTLLAQRAGIRAANSGDGEALLFGLSGFLNVPTYETAPAPAKAYLRVLWEDWWKMKEKYHRLILPSSAWKIGGNRPQNHPHRRVAALSRAAQVLDRVVRTVSTPSAENFERIFIGLTHPFWDTRWNLSGSVIAGSRGAKLVGPERTRDLLVNVWFPAVSLSGESLLERLELLRLPAVPGKIRSTADWLLPEFPAPLLRSALVQQGLLELDKDFRGWNTPQAVFQQLSFP